MDLEIGVRRGHAGIMAKVTRLDSGLALWNLQKQSSGSLSLRQGRKVDSDPGFPQAGEELV